MSRFFFLLQHYLSTSTRRRFISSSFSIWIDANLTNDTYGRLRGQLFRPTPHHCSMPWYYSLKHTITKNKKRSRNQSRISNKRVQNRVDRRYEGNPMRILCAKARLKTTLTKNRSTHNNNESTKSWNIKIWERKPNNVQTKINSPCGTRTRTGGLTSVELERLEQASTFTSTEIDHNLSRANAIIGDSIFLCWRNYAAATAQASSHVGFEAFLKRAADGRFPQLKNRFRSQRCKTRKPIDEQKTDGKKERFTAPGALGTPPSSDRQYRDLHSAASPHPAVITTTSGCPQGLACGRRHGKRTPRAADARLLVLQNFLNSFSPHFLNLPYFYSEIGCAHAAAPGAQPRSFAPHSDLGRLRQ